MKILELRRDGSGEMIARYDDGTWRERRTGEPIASPVTVGVRPVTTANGDSIKPSGGLSPIRYHASNVFAQHRAMNRRTPSM